LYHNQFANNESDYVLLSKLSKEKYMPRGLYCGSHPTLYNLERELSANNQVMMTLEDNRYVFRESTVISFAEMVDLCKKTHTLWEIDWAYRDLCDTRFTYKILQSGGQDEVCNIVFDGIWSRSRQHSWSSEKTRDAALRRRRQSGYWGHPCN